MPKTLYTEKIGPAIVTISSDGEDWIVTLNDSNNVRERTFKPSDGDASYNGPYENALYCYESTCEAAAKIHDAFRPLPEPPDFAATISPL